MGGSYLNTRVRNEALSSQLTEVLSSNWPIVLHPVRFPSNQCRYFLKSKTALLNRQTFCYKAPFPPFCYYVKHLSFCVKSAIQIKLNSLLYWTATLSSHGEHFFHARGTLEMWLKKWVTQWPQSQPWLLYSNRILFQCIGQLKYTKSKNCFGLFSSPLRSHRLHPLFFKAALAVM